MPRTTAPSDKLPTPMGNVWRHRLSWAPGLYKFIPNQACEEALRVLGVVGWATRNTAVVDDFGDLVHVPPAREALQ